MLNFTIGPVMTGEEVRKIGIEQVPYFRTPVFSAVMLENEDMVRRFAKAPKDARRKRGPAVRARSLRS